MVRRMIAGLSLVCLSVLIAVPASAEVPQTPVATAPAHPPVTYADDGLAPPPVDPTHPGLVDTYPPGDLQFYVEPASWLHPGKEMTNGLTTLLNTMFVMEGEVVRWVTRAIDYAWNFNLARAFGVIIDSVNSRYSTLVWSFAGLLFSLIAAWIAFQVWQGTYTRVAGGMAVLSLVLLLAVMTQSGISKPLAAVEDIGTDLSISIFGAGSEGGSGGVTSMTDGIYRQLILEQWARANFTNLEGAKRHQGATDIPGGAYLGLDDDRAQELYHRDTTGGKDDFWPWYASGALGRRTSIVLNTGFSLLLFLPLLILMACFVLGAKLVTILLAMGWPVALFWAAMPWGSGLRGLKRYSIWMCISPIAKVVLSFGMALYLGILDGLLALSTAHNMAGGWGTVTLIMGSLAFTLWLIARPLMRLLFGGAVARARKAERDPARVARSIANSTAQNQGRQPRRYHVSPKTWQTPTGQKLQVLRSAAHPAPKKAPKVAGGHRLTQTPAATPMAPKPVAKPSPAAKAGPAPHGNGHTRPARTWHHHAANYMIMRDKAHKAGRRLMPEYDLGDLMREAKRAMRAMANAAETATGGRRR